MLLWFARLADVAVREMDVELRRRDLRDGGPTSRPEGEVFERSDGYTYKAEDGRAYRLGKRKSPAADANVKRSGASGSAARCGELPGL